MAVSAIFVQVNYVHLRDHVLLLIHIKTVERHFYCIIMRRYFSRMHKEKGSGRALGLDPFFKDGLYFLFFNFIFILEF